MNDPVGRVKGSALAHAQPLSVQLELTYNCNWRCVFCYNPRHFDQHRLSFDEWIVVLDDLRALGTFNVSFTGGEPMTSPDFFPIAEAARERKFAIKVLTNGTLARGENARRIASLLPLAVEISIHGATADVHDAATLRSGSFDAMLAGVDDLLASNARVVLKMPLTRINEHQLEDVIALSERRGVTLQIDPQLTPRDDGDRGPLEYSASRDAIRRAYQLSPPSAETRTTGGYNCGLGRLTMAIDPEGNVFPCIQWRHRALGNVRDVRLVELWPHSEARREAADVAVAANDRLVDIGGVAAEFPFCPALAYRQTGDATEPDSAFLERAAIAAEIR